MKNTTIAAIVILVLIGAGIFFFANAQTTVSGNSITQSPSQNSNQNSRSVQKVVLTYKDYNYYPQTITVKAGQPVSISLDNSIKGCYRYFTVPQLNLQKSLPTPSDSLDFTPTQKGTYRFACGMGMGYGTLIVE